MLDRAAHRGDGARERDHQLVAGGQDLAAAVLAAAAQGREVLARTRVGRVVAARVEERRRAGEVGDQDRDEGSVHGRSIFAARAGRVTPGVTAGAAVHPGG